jgi:putative phage-type endonuclease
MSLSVIEQGTPEWHALRCGKVTASRVADVMRSGRGGKPSASRSRYMGELVTERLTGNPTQTFKSADMQWGTETEDEARSAYSFVHSAEITPVAFVDHPRIGMSGASPDGLISHFGLIEIKCPASHTHIETILGSPIDQDYITQMQWQMACTGRLVCDFVSYDPRMPEEMRLHVVRVLRDEVAITKMEKEVVKFIQELNLKIDELQRIYSMDREALA